MNYKEVIESRYNREAWQQLLHDIFVAKSVSGTVHQKYMLAAVWRNKL